MLVIGIAGGTGSGKTTQLPKLCLETGRGTRGLIACTQPRRIAARAMAERVAEELQSELGGMVGYQVRFRERSSPGGYIKFMTDGILLAESMHDRYLDAYDTGSGKRIWWIEGLSFEMKSTPVLGQNFTSRRAYSSGPPPGVTTSRNSTPGRKPLPGY